MGDYMIRATAANGQVRAFAAYTTEMVEKARRRGRPCFNSLCVGKSYH
jgi:redox-regulated HSP33 family molecular chaperone